MSATHPPIRPRPQSQFTAVLFLLFIALGVRPIEAQIVDPEEVTDLFVEWMVGSAFTGPRVFVRTEREILQTGPNTADFVQGNVQFVVADGAIGAIWNQLIPEERDSDQDGWRDVVENEYQSLVGPTSNGTNWAEDPAFGPPNTLIPADVFWTQLANGVFLPARPDSFGGGTAAIVVTPFAAPSVQITSAPPNQLAMPVTLFDYSAPLFVDTIGGGTQLSGISFYHWGRDYVGRAEGARMEHEIVPGAYLMQYPTISNPNNLSGNTVVHSLVPNGTLAIGSQKPSWLIRKVETIISYGVAPVENTFSNGRLVFDPNLPTTFKWDDLVGKGLANAVLDQFAVTIRADDGMGEMVQIWPPIAGPAIRPVYQNEFTFLAGPLYGSPGVGGNPTSPLSRDAEFVMQYSRNTSGGSLGGSSGDLSRVVLRLPVTLQQSYESWKRFFFPGVNQANALVSGPNADPDGDLLTNRQEFEMGLNPTLVDSDGNGFPDIEELPNADPDDDLLTNAQELELGTNPYSNDSDGNGVSDTFEDFMDTDGDGIQDWLELNIGFNPNSADSNGNGVTDDLEDRDGDFLRDYEEYRGFSLDPLVPVTDPAAVIYRTNLSNADTDGDGLQDGYEVYVTHTNPTSVDNDADGLNDLEELQVGSDPDVADSDGDSLLDGEEVKLFGTDPTLRDTDGDGTEDADEDHDRDLLSTRLEREITMNTGIVYNPLAEDSNSNGVTDDQEDADGDGLNNLLELQLFPSYFAYLADSDGNGISDYDEDFDMDRLSNGNELFLFGYDPTNPNTFPDGVLDGNRDPDGDGLGNADELETTLTDPLNPNSDGDPGGVLDGQEDPDGDFASNVVEIANDSNPHSADTDLDGLSDGIEIFVTLTEPDNQDSNGNNIPDYLDDQDGDFLPDGFEVSAYAGSLESLIMGGVTSFAGPDADGDGLLDIHELVLTGTDYGNPDTNGNGVLDGDEDFDGDGLSNKEELPTTVTVDGRMAFLGGTNPLIADTDGDGLNDGLEVNTLFTDPLDIDSDDDGFTDGNEVGAARDPNDLTDFPIEQLIARPRVRSFPVAAGAPPGGPGFVVEAERLAASTPSGGVRYAYSFEGSTNLSTWTALPGSEWTFSNVSPAATGDPTATYNGASLLPMVQFFRVVATPVSITP